MPNTVFKKSPLIFLHSRIDFGLIKYFYGHGATICINNDILSLNSNRLIPHFWSRVLNFASTRSCGPPQNGLQMIKSKTTTTKTTATTKTTTTTTTKTTATTKTTTTTTTKTTRPNRQSGTFQKKLRRWGY